MNDFVIYKLSLYEKMLSIISALCFVSKVNFKPKHIHWITVQSLWLLKAYPGFFKKEALAPRFLGTIWLQFLQKVLSAATIHVQKYVE